MLNNTYTTVSGDTWDIVAYKAYDCFLLGTL